MEKILFLLTSGGKVLAYNPAHLTFSNPIHAKTGINLLTPGRVAGKLFQFENRIYRKSPTWANIDKKYC